MNLKPATLSNKAAAPQVRPLTVVGEGENPNRVRKDEVGNRGAKAPEVVLANRWHAMKWETFGTLFTFANSRACSSFKVEAETSGFLLVKRDRGFEFSLGIFVE